MKIEHITIWVKDVESMLAFYERFFNARANDKYINAKKGFSSYFLQFDSVVLDPEGNRIELVADS